MEIWNSGGGTQSTAIAVLIAQGKLKPDIGVIADTQREASETWSYLDAYVLPILPIPFYRVNKHSFATVDLISKHGSILMPGYTDIKGSLGKLPGYCSNEWKQRVVQRFITKTFGCRERHVMWIGISTDEARRAKSEGAGRWLKRYPLIELGISRQDCIDIVRDYGLPTPPRSSCWMCPNRTNAEWRHLKNNAPADFKKATQLDDYLRSKDPTYFTHPDLVPLAEAMIEEPDGLDENGKPCASGMCFV